MMRVLWLVAVCTLQLGLLMITSTAADVEDNCIVKGIPASGCAFTDGPCLDLEQCENTCTVHTDRAASKPFAEDRAFSPSWWSMCPQLAFMVNTALEITASNSTRRILGSENNWPWRTARTMHEQIISAAVHPRPFGTGRVPMTHPGVPSKHLHSPSRQLLQSTDDASAASPEIIQSCPTTQDVASVAEILGDFAREFKEVLALHATGGELGSELVDWEKILEEPNTFLTLSEFLKDSDKLSEYLSKNCTDTEVTTGFWKLQYAPVLIVPDNDVKYDLEYGDSWIVCGDNFGASPAYEQHNFPTSLACAQAFQQTYNITDGGFVFAEVAKAALDLNTACNAFTTQDTCIEASASGAAKEALDRIDALHAQMAFPNPSNLTEPFTNPASVAAQAESGSDDSTPLPGAVRSADSPMPEESVARLSNPSDSISPGSKSQAPPQKKNNFPVAVTVGGGIAALLVIAAAIVGALLIMRQRKRNKQRAGGRSLAKGTRKLAPENRGVDYQQGTNATQSWPSTEYGSGPPGVGGPSHMSMPGQPPYYQGMPPHPHWASSLCGGPSGFSPYATTSSGGYGAAGSAMGGSIWDNNTITRGSNTWGSDGVASFRSIPTIATPEGAAATQQLEQILDGMHATKVLLGDRFELAGSEHRRTGSHGIVEAAEVPGTSERVAIKLFIDKQAFAMEQHLFSLDSLKSVLVAPAVIANLDGVVRSPHGYVFPPHTVAEAGEPLETWMSGKNSADVITCVQLLSQVLRAVKALHSEGYAHRNIKPSNILRRLKQHDWILADLACAAPLGSTAPPIKYRSRLHYCAPEAVADPALPLEQQPPVAVCGSADVWAVGVIAFELLTEERVFPPEATDEDIMRALRGGGLPWDAWVPGQQERCRKLRGLKRAVMACLERDESKRPSAKSLLSSWESLFDTMKTQGTFEPIFEPTTVGSVQGGNGVLPAANPVDGSRASTREMASQVDNTASSSNNKSATSDTTLTSTEETVSPKLNACPVEVVSRAQEKQLTAATDIAPSLKSSDQNAGAVQSYSHGMVPESFRSAGETFEVTQETFSSAQGTLEFGEGEGGERHVSESSKVFMPE